MSEEILKRVVEDYRKYREGQRSASFYTSGPWDYKWFIREAFQQAGDPCTNCETEGVIPVYSSISDKRTGFSRCEPCAGVGYV